MLKKIKNILVSNTRNCKGMTLVEVIVAMVIATIVVGITGGMLISSTSLFNNTASKVENERIASTILDFTMSELRFATEIEMPSDPTVKKGRGLIYMMDASGNNVEKGMVAFKRPSDTQGARNIYGDSFYNGRTVGIRIEPLTVKHPKVIRIFVDVFDRDDKLVYTDSGTIEIPNVPDDKEPDNTEPRDYVLIGYGALPDKTTTPAAINP